MQTAAYVAAGLLLLWAALGALRHAYHRKTRKSKVICVVESRCTGCRRCCKRCTRRVLEVVQGEAGARAAVAWPDRCTACGDCLGKCKFKALRLAERG
jgi:ferredoxin